MNNKSPEQHARDRIDLLLQQSGWTVQDRKGINWSAGLGVAVREYPTSEGPADYILFVNRKPVGVIEAKREEKGESLATVEDQSQGYRSAKLQYLDNAPLPFAYESTGEVTWFTDHLDPKPRSRRVFAFHRPETFQEWLKQPKSLRGRL